MRVYLLAPVLIATILASVSCNRNSGPDPASANLAPTGQTPLNAYGEPQAAATQLVSAPQPPPPLPSYSQPECPGENYIWTPGYWSYSDAGYYWVPGVWVLAPYTGALWTPPYWGYDGRRYIWHAGYWGRHIGYYGGVNYGFGYTGLGFYGGYWNGGVFFYNRSASNVNTRVVRNLYSHPVVNYTPFNRVSYNGPGGVARQPVAAELAVRRESRTPPLPAQVEHVRQAAATPGQFAGENHGRPAAPALQRPLEVRNGQPRLPRARSPRPRAARNTPVHRPCRNPFPRVRLSMKRTAASSKSCVPRSRSHRTR